MLLRDVIVLLDRVKSSYIFGTFKTKTFPLQDVPSNSMIMRRLKTGTSINIKKAEQLQRQDDTGKDACNLRSSDLKEVRPDTRWPRNDKSGEE